jgi:fucose permease
MITALCLAAILVMAFSSQVFPSFLTRIAGSSGQQGLLLFSMFFFYPVGSVLGGSVADRLGKRRVLAAGMFLMGLPFALSALLPTLAVRTAAVLLFGLGTGAVESQVSALLSDANPSRERSVLNWSQLMFSAGASGGPFLIALLFTLRTGTTVTRVLWACAAAAAMLAALFALSGREEPPARRMAPRAGARGVATIPATSTRGARTNPETATMGFRALIGSPGLLLLAVAIFLYVAAEMGTASWLAKYGEVHLGLSAELAPVCITIFWGGQSVSRILAGTLSARVTDAAVLYSSILLALAGQVFAFAAGHPIGSLIGLGVVGVGMGAIWPTLVALAGARYRQSSGLAIGILTASGGVAVALIQLAVGWLARPGLLGLRFTLLALAGFTAANLFIVRRALRLRPAPTRLA